METREEQVGVCDDCKHICHCGRTDCEGPEHCKCKNCQCNNTNYWVDEENKPYKFG